MRTAASPSRRPPGFVEQWRRLYDLGIPVLAVLGIHGSYDVPD
jgi:hypothetical protein